MRLTLLPLVAFLFCSLVRPTPIPLQAREVATIEKQLKACTASLRRLSLAISTLNSSAPTNVIAQQEQEIENRSVEVTNTLKDGARDIRSAGMVLPIEVGRVFDPVASVQRATQTLMDNWVSAKPVIVRLGGREPVLRRIMEGNVATDELIDAIVSRLPLADRGFARAAGQRSKDYIEDAIKVYRKP